MCPSFGWAFLQRLGPAGDYANPGLFCQRVVTGRPPRRRLPLQPGGQIVIRRQLKRRAVLTFFQKLPPCLIGIEACASSHHWSRELQALGHAVRLMPPAYVKPYVKRHKNDAIDAEAICEAVTRPNMRFVATKTSEQQSCLTLHRTRHLSSANRSW
jgi:transposase